jgi:putative two-component system response regulator
MLIALVAVGFFLPSLVLAGVPMAAWVPYTLLALVAATLIAGSFITLRRGSRFIYPSVVASSAVLGLLGSAYRPYYHEIGLLYALVVAALAVVHGFGPAILMAAIGGVVVPVVIQGGFAAGSNATDPVYSVIYLAGAALIPWVAGRLAKGRLVEVRRHLAAVTEAEHEAVQMLARAAEAKDDVTGGHVNRVGGIAAALARSTGLDPERVDEIRYAAMLHDVGKLHVPDRILMKPGSLDPEEWEIVRRHTIWGEQILGSAAAFEVAGQVARWHHENWDGSGYPDRLSREEVPLAARIVHLADVFDALRSDRPYKPAWPTGRVLEEIARNAGRMFDPDLVRELIRLIELEAEPDPPRVLMPDVQLPVRRGTARPVGDRLPVGGGRTAVIEG